MVGRLYDQAMATSTVSPSTARWALVATILGSSIAFIDGTVVNVALPAIQRDLGGGLAAQQWIVDAYLLTLGSLILVGGSLGDIFGEVRMFTLGVGLFGLASTLCAVAPTSTTLIAFRAIQGVAGALLTPASLAVLTSTFSGEARGTAIGTWTAWSGISTVVGPLLGGWLIGFTSWRVIFLLNVPIAIATVVLVRRHLPHGDHTRTAVRVDVAGAAMCVAGLGLLVFGFIEQPRLGWGEPAVPGTILGGAALLVSFVFYESRTAMPMLPLRLFRSRNFSAANIETFAVYGGLSAWGFFLSLYLQQIAGYSPFQAGLATVPLTIGMFLLSRYFGRMSMRFGPRLFMAAGPLVGAGSILALARLPTHPDYWVDLFPALVGFAIALSLTVAPLTTTVLSDAGAGDAGIASGINNAVARVSGLIAIAVIGVAAAGNTDHLAVQGFHRAMLIVSVLLAVGGVIGAVGIRNPKHAPVSA
jgi:EmrB/QacA subfamily drug resistance transporter